MWHDNETDIDLLGFDQLVDTVVYLAQTSHLRPITIGVFGDWGSGKSSLMRMANNELLLDSRYVCVSFSPWQHESYDDLKTAIMSSVMAELHKRRSLFQMTNAVVSGQIERLWKRLVKRVNVFRAISFTVKGAGAIATLANGDPIGIPLAASGVGDLGQVFRPENMAEAAERAASTAEEFLGESEESDEESESVERSVSEFRSDFAELLEKLDVEAVVIFIDDLDRCLPPSIVETLEAIRLFLAVPKTAFVIGADERIIRHAIATRYPELASQSVNIGRDYLEKIVQVPVRIAPLTDQETEAYLNLLGCQLYLSEEQHRDMVTTARENRAKAALDVAMNYGIAVSKLGEIPAGLEAHMQLVARIAPTLCGGLEGNPRQAKRFMNTLLLRMRIASKRGVSLEPGVLAKLMLLEYFHEAHFRQLFTWQLEDNGRPEALRALEAAVQDNGKSKTKPAITAAMSSWLDDARVKAWLSLEPPLSDVNLEPYFYFSRDRVLAPTAPTRRLSQQLQELLGQLISESDAEHKLGVDAAAKLTAEEFRPVFEELAGRFQRDPRSLDNKLGGRLAELAAQKRELIPTFAQALRVAPVGSIQPALALTLRTQFGAGSALATEMGSVLQDWFTQTTAPNLAAAAKRALRPGGGR